MAMTTPAATMTMGKAEYTHKARCHVCGKDFLARYNVAARAKVCTSHSHKCKPGKRGGKEISCLDGCCRSKYRRGVAAMAGASIDARKFLNQEEYSKVVAATHKLIDPEGITLRFILETGCRLGEALLVRATHLEWRDGPLSIVRVPTLKKAGHPVLPVHLDNAGDFVKELRAWAKGCKPDDPLFPVARRTLQRAFERILDKVKPDRASLVHILRHTRASRLSDLGLPPNVIREEMRWSSIELLKVYSHTTEAEVAKALGKLR